MPDLPMHVCPGCRQLVSGRCLPCLKRQRADYDRGRNGQPHRIAQRTWRWIQYSKVWLAAHPFCGERQDGEQYPNQSLCVQQGLMRGADVTDHIIPTSKGGSVWNPKNHQSLCFRCNTAKGDSLPSQPDGAFATEDDAVGVFA